MEPTSSEETSGTSPTSQPPETPIPPTSESAVTDKATVAEEPEFPSVSHQEASRTSPLPLERFYDVRVPIWAELGRIEMTIGELLKLAPGAVVELERNVGEPVEIVSQGVKLAIGEVVVVDDRFAIRIKELHSSK